MAKTKKHTLEFKEKVCGHCSLADTRELRKGRPNYCGYKNETGRDPDIKNGHCAEMKPKNRKRKKTEVSE